MFLVRQKFMASRLKKATIIPIYLPAGYISRKWDRIEKDLTAYLKGPVKELIRNWLYLTVTGWRNKPFFRSTFSFYGGSFMSIYVYPVGGFNRMKWVYISRGVAGRWIYARRAPYLVYQQGYRARTQPGGQWGIAGGGRYYGPIIKGRTSVWWDGIEARDYEGFIVNKINKQVVLGVKTIIVKAVLK